MPNQQAGAAPPNKTRTVEASDHGSEEAVGRPYRLGLAANSSYRRRFPFASTMLGCPGGFGAGCGVTAGAGAGSTFASSSFSRRTRGESG